MVLWEILVLGLTTDVVIALCPITLSEQWSVLGAKVGLGTPETQLHSETDIN